jgi:hypothetical protein
METINMEIVIIRTISLIIIKFILSAIAVTLTLAIFGCGKTVTDSSSMPIQDTNSVITKTTQLPQAALNISSYCGITLSTSTKIQVERLFGKPIWSGEPEREEVNENSEEELLYEYEDICDVKGRTSIFFNARTGIVRSISVYPKQLSLKQVIERYGDEYIKRDRNLGPCLTKEEKQNYKPSEITNYPVFYVYLQKGIYVSIQKDESVLEIGYVNQC